MNPKLTPPLENIESQIMADLLRPLSPAEIERLTVDAIVTHRRLIDEADRLYQAVPDAVASKNVNGNEQYVAYVKASLDMCQRRSKSRPRGGAKVGHYGAGLRPPGGRSPSGGLRPARHFFRSVSTGLSGAALSETIAVAVHLEDVDMVGDAIEQGTS